MQVLWRQFIVPMWKKRRSLLNMKHLMQKSSSAASEKHWECSPYLVCESSQDGVIGYAYGSNLYDRAAYRWDTELSIYLSQSHRGKGIGSALYRGLLGLLKLQGYCKAYACITYPNDESVKFHQNFGFKQCGYFQQSGFKLGQWHDVIWMDKPLISTGYHSAPGVLKYVDSLDQEVVAAILIQAIKGNDLGY